MAQKKINIAYVGISKTATENKLHTLPSTLRGMIDVVTDANSNTAEKESTKKVLFGLLGITSESEVANVVNLSNEVKKMRKACYNYYPYMQTNDGEAKIFLSRKGCYYRRQGTNDTPIKGYFFVENENYNNIIHESEKSRKKGTAQKEVFLYTLYDAKGVSVEDTEIDDETETEMPIGYTLYSKCEDDKTGETYFKKWKNQPFEVSVIPAETLKLEESITQEKDTQEKDIKAEETQAKPKKKTRKTK